MINFHSSKNCLRKYEELDCLKHDSVSAHNVWKAAKCCFHVVENYFRFFTMTSETDVTR